MTTKFTHSGLHKIEVCGPLALTFHAHMQSVYDMMLIGGTVGTDYAHFHLTYEQLGLALDWLKEQGAEPSRDLLEARLVSQEGKDALVSARLHDTYTSDQAVLDELVKKGCFRELPTLQNGKTHSITAKGLRIAQLVIEGTTGSV